LYVVIGGCDEFYGIAFENFFGQDKDSIPDYFAATLLKWVSTLFFYKDFATNVASWFGSLIIVFLLKNMLIISAGKFANPFLLENMPIFFFSGVAVISL
jgi:hypothetical protein